MIVAPITTLFGTLGGYWLAGRNDEARDKRAAARETASRRAALAERLEEDRHAFQRDVLLELQEALEQLLRMTVHRIGLHQDAIEAEGHLSRAPAETAAKEDMQAKASVPRLQTRVLDDQLRTAANAFAERCARAALGLDFVGGVPDSGREQAVKQLQRQVVELSQDYEYLTNLLGAGLRREIDRRYLVSEPSSEVPS